MTFNKMYIGGLDDFAPKLDVNGYIFLGLIFAAFFIL